MKCITLFLIILPIFAYSQNIGVGTTNPDPSAKLEVQSTTGGVLIPRLTSSERDLIPTPATGLLVYNSINNRFEFFNGNSWCPVASVAGSAVSDLDGDTKIDTEQTVDEDTIRMQVDGHSIAKFDKNTFHLEAQSHGTFIGLNAGKALPTSDSWNTFIGHRAGENTNSGISNTFLGAYSGSVGNKGSANTFVGVISGEENTGDNNTFLGIQAGQLSSGANDNTYIGAVTGQQNTGSQNIGIGFFSSYTGSGSNNIGIGRHSLFTVGNGSSNLLAIGDSTLQVNGQNISFPFQGIRNTAIGHKTLKLNTTGLNNTALGYHSLENNNSGGGNTALGANASNKNEIGSNNTAIGAIALYNNTQGVSNTAIGTEAGRFSSGSRNTFVGTQSGVNNISGSGNIFIGNQAGEHETGSDKLYIHNNSSSTPLIYGDLANNFVKINESLEVENNSQTGEAILGLANGENGKGIFGESSNAGNYTNFGGYFVSRGQSGFGVYGNAMGAQGIGVYGEGSLYAGLFGGKVKIEEELILKLGLSDEDTDTQILLESLSGQDNDSIQFYNGGAQSLVVDALSNNGRISFHGPNENILIGENSGFHTTTGKQNIFMGNRSGNIAFEGDKNVVVGNNSGVSYLKSRNVLMGNGVAYVSNNLENNVIIGDTAFASIMSGAPSISSNVIIGSKSGLNYDGGNYNVLLGAESGFGGGGDGNVNLGYQSGLASAGSNNIFLGKGAGKQTGEGSTIAIGEDAGALSYGTSISIGKWAGASSSSSNSIFLGNNMGGNEFRDNVLRIGFDPFGTLIYGEFDNNKVEINNNLYSESLHINAENEHNDADLYMKTNVGTEGRVLSREAGTQNIYLGDIDNTGGDIIYRTAAQERMRINATGDIGIGTSSPSEKLHVIGNILATGSITENSDMRFKSELTPITSALSKLNYLNGYYYFLNTTAFPEKEFSTDRQIGVVAQEVEELFPEMVFTDEKGYKSVNYSRLTPVMIEAMKELTIRNEQLEKKLDQLEHSQKIIQNDLSNLKSLILQSKKSN